MKLPAKLAIASLAIVTAATSASAQNATTDPVGFSTISVRAKTTAAKAVTFAAIPMERATAYSSTAPSVSLNGSNQTVLTFPSSVFTSDQFNGAGNKHYIKLTNGSNEGDWSEVVATSTNSITLADDFSAVIISSTTTFDIIPFWTLGTAFPNGAGLQNGTSAATADTVAIYNPSFSPTTYFYSSTNNQWRTGITNSNNATINPGAGIQIERKQNSSVDIKISGSVPLGPQAADINGSGSPSRSTLAANIYPLASKKLSELGLYTGNSSTGVAAGTSAATADTVTIYNSSGVPTTYFYNSTANQWRTGITNSNDVTIPEGASVLVTRKGSRAPFTWYMPQPIMNLN